MIYIFNIKTLNELLNLKPEQYKTVQGIEFLQLPAWFSTLSIENLESLKKILPQCSLKKMSLRNSNLGILNDDCFKKFCDIISQCQDLKKIHFCEERLDQLSPERLEILMAALSHCKKLKEINLEGNRIGAWDNEQLKILGKGLLNFKALKVIRLGRNNLNKLKSFGYQTLFGFLTLSLIEELHLEGNDIGLLDSACLTEFGRACAQMENLKLLNISDNRLDNLGIPGFQALFNLLAPSYLQVLDLEDNGLGNSNLPPQCFTVLGNVCGKFKNLQILSLAKNQFNQLKYVCFKEFKTGVRQSNTLCEIQGIHNFNVSHQKALCEIIARNEESDKENRPIDNKLKQENPNPKRLFFVHDCPSAEPEIVPMASKTTDHSFNSMNTKRLKTGKNTTSFF